MRRTRVRRVGSRRGRRGPARPCPGLDGLPSGASLRSQQGDLPPGSRAQVSPPQGPWELLPLAPSPVSGTKSLALIAKIFVIDLALALP